MSVAHTFVFLVSFESAYARHGGLGAVMSILPQHLPRQHSALITPYFHNVTNLEKERQAGHIESFQSLFSFAFPVGGSAYEVEVMETVGNNGFRTYLLKSPGFFQASENPYLRVCNPDQPLDPYRNPVHPTKLAEDSLFFCAALPIALCELHKENKIPADHLLLHLQDWETAAAANAVQVSQIHPELTSIRCCLTLHNPYDFPLTSYQSATLDGLKHYLQMDSSTVLSESIPLMESPISTVSENFAIELQHDLLFTAVFAPHLQNLLDEKGIIGINNGLFGKAAFPFSQAAETAAESQDFTVLLKEKQVRRAQLNKELKQYQKSLREQNQPFWGQNLDIKDSNRPVFLVLGRDDPRQKGFDVLAAAIEQLPPDQAYFIFAPMPGDEGLLGLNFLRELAENRPDSVIVFPFRLSPTMFHALQQGSSFMVMPSLYEPFGAATEAYLGGMPVVARATGGLVQQVAPHPNCESCLGAIGQNIVLRYHTFDSPPTGFLFREDATEDEAYFGWKQIVDCAYWRQNPKGNRIQDRQAAPLFHDLVHNACDALQLATRFYQNEPLAYAEMIYRGYQSLARFSWENACQAYYERLYKIPFPESTN